MTEQPKWKCVGHMGDVDPIAYGGGFVYVDETGVYTPEMTWFEPALDEEWNEAEDKDEVKVTVYRLTLDPPRFKTLTDEGKRLGLHTREMLPADRNKLWHWYEEWFVSHLASVAETCGTTKFHLLRDLFSKDAVRRASAYQELILCNGAFEFDQYPLEMTEKEAYARYAEEMKLSRGKRILPRKLTRI